MSLLDVARQHVMYWPRRAAGLPPGQRALDVFPRFADDPRRRPPAVPDVATLRVRRTDTEGVAFDAEFRVDELGRQAPVVEATADFHCVTTWTARGRRWTGVGLRRWWEHAIGQLPASRQFATVVGHDGHLAVFVVDDLFDDRVILAWALDGTPLDDRHGAPLRLVSPAQYGYKNVKHVAEIGIHTTRPASRLGAKEHLRARVVHEERHSRWPARLVRWPYRLAVPTTSFIAERTARPAPPSG